MTADRGSAVLLTFARRGEDEAILAAATSLGQLAPEVVAIGTPVSAPVLRGLGIVDVIAIGEGTSARAALVEVRARGPRVAAVVYGDAGLEGHLKLEALALLTGAPRVLRVRPGHPAQCVGRARLALIAAGKAGQAAGLLAMGTLVCGIAWCRLRVAQRLSGGRHASRN